MFVGHYGPALMARSLAPSLSLGGAFLSTQLLDIVQSILVIAGVEHLVLDPGEVGRHVSVQVQAPYSHGLLGALTISLATGLLAGALHSRRGARQHAVTSGAVHAALVLSHWPLDLLAHEVRVVGDVHVGLGVSGVPGFAVETVILGAGLMLWWLRAEGIARGARIGMPALTIAMIAFLGVTMEDAPPEGPLPFALSNLGAYGILAALAGWIDHRSPRACHDDVTRRRERT